MDYLLLENDTTLRQRKAPYFTLTNPCIYYAIIIKLLLLLSILGLRILYQEIATYTKLKIIIILSLI